VCHERQKNVIITKCCHVFCDRCAVRHAMHCRSGRVLSWGVGAAAQGSQRCW
jgi:hypothetical protein